MNGTMQNKPAVFGLEPLNKRKAEHLIAHLGCKYDSDWNATFHAVEHFTVVILVSRTNGTRRLNRVLNDPRTIVQIERRHIGVEALFRVMDRKRKGLLGSCFTRSCPARRSLNPALRERSPSQFSNDTDTEGYLPWCGAEGWSKRRRAAPHPETTPMPQRIQKARDCRHGHSLVHPSTEQQGQCRSSPAPTTIRTRVIPLNNMAESQLLRDLIPRSAHR